MISPSELFDLSDFANRDVFPEDGPVWGALDELKGYLAGFFEGTWPLARRTGLIERTLVISDGEVREDLVVRPTGKKGRLQAFDGDQVKEDVAIIQAGAYLSDDQVILGAGAVVESGALIKGPTVVGKNTEVRQGAYIRGTCLVGDGCVVGHTTEIKASIMLDGAKAGHFAYIGDSILGRDVNLGAGTKLANLKMIPGQVMVRVRGKPVKTGRRKLGAILGDTTETGCNSVTSPGTIVGPRSVIYPGVVVPPGYHAGRTFVRPSRTAVNIKSMR